jgi:small redox-active disulfide protein 2
MTKGCCPKGLRKIRVADFEAGVTGLDTALEEACRAGRRPDAPDLGAKLVSALRKAGNYISPSEETAYAEALVRLYANFLAQRGQRSDTTRLGERSTRMKIEILGPGCARCRATEDNVRKALAELHVEADVVHVTDVREFAKRGVMLTPGVLIDGTLRSTGRIPSVEEIMQWLQADTAPAR